MERGLRVKNKPYDDACNMDTKTSIQQKASQAVSEINRLDGEDNLFQYILCLLKYSSLPAYSVKYKDIKTRLMEHLASHAGYELIDRDIWLKTQLFVLRNMFKNN